MKLLNLSFAAMLVVESAAAAVQTTSPALAQSYPSRPIRWVVPLGPGGAADTLVRIIGQKLSEQWGKPVVIDNRPGANGIIGTNIVAKSTPDGLTWLTIFLGGHATNASFRKHLPYDTVKDFTAVAALAKLPFVLVVNANLPVRNLREFVALAKKRPGQLAYGGPSGSVNHLFGVMLGSTAGIDLMFVPYRGAAAALIDTLAGRIQFSFASSVSTTPFVRSGKLRALTVGGAKRSDALQDVPTGAESGFPDFDVPVWFGIVVPAGTPAAVIGKINAGVNRLLTQTEVIERFSIVGAEPLIATPEQFEKIVRDDIVKWAKVIKDSGASGD